MHTCVWAGGLFDRAHKTMNVVCGSDIVILSRWNQNIVYHTGVSDYCPTSENRQQKHRWCSRSFFYICSFAVTPQPIIFEGKSWGYRSLLRLHLWVLTRGKRCVRAKLRHPVSGSERETKGCDWVSVWGYACSRFDWTPKFTKKPMENTVNPGVSLFWLVEKIWTNSFTTGKPGLLS